jgi:hypothetical protein
VADLKLSHLALRTTAGAFILNAGVGKWSGSEETATGVHGMAVGTYPFLAAVPPRRFLKLLAATEIGLGAALLTPLIPAGVAGAALTGFAGGLLGLYLRTPGMHSRLRPTQRGTAIAKDVWLLGIGVGLLADDVADRRSAA